MKISRRRFLTTAGAGIAAVTAFEAGAWKEAARTTHASGLSPAFPGERVLGPIPKDPKERLILRMSELNRLPWFEVDELSRLRLASGTGIPPIIDVHTHVGWSQGLGADIDMTARSPVRYFWDYEITQDFLNVQMHPTQEEASAMAEETKYLIFKTPERNKTHTAANLVAEMERFNHARSVMLPVEIPVRSRHGEQTRRAATVDDRLIAFSGIHPWRWSEEKEKKLASTYTGGVRGLKFHPVFQFMAPDHPDAMKMFEWCAAHDVVVLAHTGFTGSEPAFMQAYAEPERYAAPLKTFPKLKMIFGHTGARRRFHEAFAVAKRFEEQVWVEFSGQPVPHIRTVLDHYDPSRIVYGTDWPYYPLAVALARFLVATEGREHLRQAILHDNAARLLNLNLA